MAKPKTTVVQPTIKPADNTKHPIEALFESDTAPVLTSIGYVKLPNTTTYVAYVIKSQGKEILSVEVEEPNVRMIAEESSKIAFVTSFQDKDE